MRPVNLMPPEERRGLAAQSRTGPLPYVVLGALVAALAAVALTVATSNKVSDRKSELASLEVERAAAEARAEALTPYAELASLAQQRTETVTSLAQSRFDWDRVLRELALVIPDEVWLTQLEGTVSPDVQPENGPDVQLRAAAPGPALSIVGCASSHEEVAAFLQALRDIDGVTRVSIATDERPDPNNGDASASGTSDTDCRTREFISRFEIVASFDAVSVPASTAPSTTAPSAAPVSTSDDGGVAEAEAERAETSESAGEQTEEAGNAAEVIPGVAR